MPDFGDFGDEALFEEPVQRPFHTDAPSSFVETFDTMEISDEEEEFIDLSKKPQPIRKPYRPRKKAPTPPPISKTIDYTIIPETGGFITATCPNTGLNIYFSKKTLGESKNKKDAMFKELTSKGNSRGLLTKPLWQLRREIEKENAAELARIEK
jgi:hypothetical protein